MSSTCEVTEDLCREDGRRMEALKEAPPGLAVKKHEKARFHMISWLFHGFSNVNKPLSASWQVLGSHFERFLQAADARLESGASSPLSRCEV